MSTNCPTPQPHMVWVPTAGTPVMPLYSSTGYGTAISSLSTSFVPSLPFTVTIAVTPASTSSVFAIEEHMPSGWVVSNVSDQGVFSSTTASVRWGLFVDGQACTVSYDVTPPTNAASYGVFSGVVSFDGVNVPITGTRKTVRTSP